MAYQKKKAQGLSINTIIIAALGLAVLVILFAVMTGRLSVFGKGVDSTQQQLTGCGQQCQVQGYVSGSAQAGPTCQNGERIFGNFQGFQEGQICCCSRT